VYLEENLSALASQIESLPKNFVELIVSDNCSSDQTPEVVERHISNGLEIKYLRNKTNLGWARNFIQCFRAAKGQYVLLLGDDDQLMPNCLNVFSALTEQTNFGVIALQPFGYDNHVTAEQPNIKRAPISFKNSNEFILAVSQFFTLTSALIINKDAVSDVNPDEFLTTDIATFHIFLRASLNSKKNLFVREFLIASKRQNSFNYNYADVFVVQFWEILFNQRKHGLKEKTIQKLLKKRLLTYYPFYLYDLRLNSRADIHQIRQYLSKLYSDSILYRVWLLPILVFPLYLGLAWGLFTTIIGRVIAGDLIRGLYFLRSKASAFVWNRIVSKLRAQ
jgi:glycosyltransferase involved in cell wall biosynthesis